MRLYERFKRLTVWNKIAVVGSIASIVAFPLPFVFRYLGASPSPGSDSKTDPTSPITTIRDPSRELSEKKQLGESVLAHSTFADIFESDFNDEVLSSKRPVLVHVYASYDSAYQLMEPFLETVAKQYDRKVKFVRLDWDVNMNLAVKLGSHSESLLILYVNGREQGRLIGAASQKAITRLLDSVVHRPGDQ